MDHTRFRKSVYILVGLGFPRRIESAMEGYMLLQNWPQGARTGAHVIALKACKAAIAGDIDPETAYSALVAFADRQGILLPGQAAWQPHGHPPQEAARHFDRSIQ
jgi:hypothetical protein